MKTYFVVCVSSDEEMGYETPEDVQNAIEEAVRNHDDSLQIKLTPINETSNLKPILATQK